MSFSVYLNSASGTRVAGSLNQITYDFAFDKTPEHKGGYKVSMVFATNIWNVANFNWSFKTMYVNADLGTCDSYTPVGLYTGTKNNQVLGTVGLDDPQPFVIQTNPTPNPDPPAPPTQFVIGTASIPANSATDAYTETESIVSNATSYNFTPFNRANSAYYEDNLPIYLQTKPTKNQFNVTLTNANGTLHTDFANAPNALYYSMILTFEAV